MNSSQ
jgi:hypothetical protein